MKKSFVSMSCLVFSLAVCAAVPTAEIGTVKMSEGHLVVNYALSADAVVTAEIQTNVTGTASGSEFAPVAAEDFVSVSGDIFKVVPAGGARSFRWRASNDLQDIVLPAGAARVKLTVWPTNDPPDFLVVDTTATEPNGKFVVNYYPSAAAIPYGITNIMYKTVKYPMRRMHAKGVEWQMGSFGDYMRDEYALRERAHLVAMDHDYYIAVYELSYCQRGCLRKFTSKDHLGNTMPLRNCSYSSIRGSSHWPDPPPAGSDLALQSAYLPFELDLPSEAEWEFAARGGHGDGRWGDGSVILNDARDANLGRIAFFGGNNNSVSGGWSAGSTMTNIGTKASNDFCLFDMNGNMRELTLDWYQEDITWNFDGRPNANGFALADGITERSNSDPVVVRGGCYADYMKNCRSAYRDVVNPGSYTDHTSYRCVTRSITR